MFTFIMCKSSRGSFSKSEVETLQNNTRFACVDTSYSLNDLAKLEHYNLCRMFSMQNNELQYNLETILSCINQNRNEFSATDLEEVDSYIASIICRNDYPKDLIRRFNCFDILLLDYLIPNKDFFRKSLKALISVDQVYNTEYSRIHVGYKTSLEIILDSLKGDEFVIFMANFHEFQLGIESEPEHKKFSHYITYLEPYVEKALK